VPPKENPFPADADSLTSFAAEPGQGEIVGPRQEEIGAANRFPAWAHGMAENLLFGSGGVAPDSWPMV